jgi:hypothetical protein
VASSEACWRWRRRDHIKPRETPPRSIIEVVEVIDGRERVGELSVEEGGGGDEWGRAEQKGKVKRDMNSQRATLVVGRGASALGVGDLGDQRDAHALIATVLWNCIELFLEGR